MHAATLLAAAALWASATAIPAANPNLELAALEKRADETAAWVSVDDEGQPATTYTPSVTTVDGTTSIVDAAPHDITATVFTWTQWGEITTSTGSPPPPVATGRNGQGAFARCHNMDGENAPFCDPYLNSTLIVDKTYYITWDPDFYNTTHDNTTWEVAVRLEWLNHSSNAYEWLDTSSRVPAAWGFWPFHVDKGKYFKSKNITVTLLSSVEGSDEKHNSTTLPLFLSEKPLPKHTDPKTPKGQELTIALPTVFGFIVLMLVGGYLWNRKTRKINIGNIMGRNRGYSGRSTRRMFGGRKDNGIQLDTRHTGSEYHDAPPTRARRGSDGLDSLANSPVEGSFHQQGTTGGSNAFRDEIRRQELERR